MPSPPSLDKMTVTPDKDIRHFSLHFRPAMQIERAPDHCRLIPQKATALNLLLQALELPLKRGKPPQQPTLFDSLSVES